MNNYLDSLVELFGYVPATIDPLISAQVLACFTNLKSS
jgi:hypothetical protein